MNDDNAITQRVIGCAIAVHKSLGPGLLEAAYEASPCNRVSARRLEFRSASFAYPLPTETSQSVNIGLISLWKRLVIVEVKSVERFDPVFESQLLTYLRMTNLRLGLLINFNSRLLIDGVRRFIR